jgi:zinc protease
VNGKANALGQAVVMYGDAMRVNTDLAKLQAVTADQIKEVVNKYIAGKKKVVLEYLPETMKASPPKRPPPPSPPAKKEKKP